MNAGLRSRSSTFLTTSIWCILVASTLFCEIRPAAAASLKRDPGRSSSVGKSRTDSVLLQNPEAEGPDDSKQVPPVVYCIVILSCQFLIIHAALALCRTVHELNGTAKGRLEGALRACAQTFTYGPMLCALFIACHMRVQRMLEGSEDPPEWMQTLMYALTLAVLASAILVLIIQFITGKPLPPNLKVSRFDLEMCKDEPHFNKISFWALTVLRYLVLIALYAGLTGMILVILGDLSLGAKQFSHTEAPAPAIACTLILSVAFFFSQFIIAICRSYLELTHVEHPQVVGMLHAAATTVELAPMLAVLFLACHMRAFQHDVPPQDWAHNCMVASTGATCLMSLLAFMVPLTLGGVLKTNTWINTWTSEVRLVGNHQQVWQPQRSRGISRVFRDEVTFEVPSPILGYIFMTLRCLCMLCVHGGAVGVMISIFAFESPGPLATMPVSPSLQCIVNLTGHFFFVYFVMTVMLTVSELAGGTMPMERWSIFSAVEAARSTMAFAPVLALIFTAVRLLGLPLADANSVSQHRIQNAMYASTWSLQVSGLMCLATGLVMAPVEVDPAGQIVNKFTKWRMGIAMAVVRYMAMMVLCGGLFIVIIGMFTLTPDIAIRKGALPL